MVIRGNTRGNGPQLATYLTGSEQNDHVQILEVAGRLGASEAYLQQTLQTMSLTAELTKSPKGLYHAQINPAYNEDRQMTANDWLQAADILGEQLGLDGQRRVIVLHTKKNRTHAHVVFERYNHQTGKVISNSFSRLAQDRARKEMERVFEHAPTPHRNTNRAALKEVMTKLWQNTATGPDFIQSVHDNGYLIAAGVPRHPFMVVDDTGRSFDLVRQLDEVRIKEVRQRLRDTELIPEKQAIEIMRERQEGNSDAGNAQHQKADAIADRTTERVDADDKPASQQQSEPLHSRHKLMADFIQMGQEQTSEQLQNDSLEEKKVVAGAFLAMGDELTNKAEESVESDHAPDQVDEPELDQDMTGKTQSNESRQRQQKVVEQFAINRKEIDQLSMEPDNKRHQVTLKNFMQVSEESVEQGGLTENAAQRQQAAARQFFENEDLTTLALTDEENKIKCLMQEQKVIRERSRQKTKKRTH